MTMRELDRLKVIQDVMDGRLKPWRAAERLGLTTRQIRRLVGRLREHGPQGLVSRQRSKPSNNRLDRVTAERALSIIRERYADFGPTLACEKLQDRLVKELRLRGINTLAEANAWAPSFMAAYNARFAKPPRSDFDAHRPLRADENLDTVLTWREPRIVTKALTVQYDRVMYLLDDTPENRKLIRRYVEVWEYPDGRIEIRAEGRVLPYREYDRLTEVDQGAIVEHKRLGHVLQVSQVIQAQRDNERIGKAPSRTHRGDSTRTERKQSHARKKKQREFTQADIEQVIVDLAGQKQPSQALRKPGHRSAGVNGTDANALPVHDPIFDTA
ncbi:Integrase catalytic subunit [Paraburkholderia sacchari]